MSKKLLIYGLAFGSLTASISYVYITKVAYSASLAAHLISILTETILFPSIGIFFLLRNVKAAAPEQFMLGRAVFLSFFLSIIIGASVSLLFSFISQFHPEYIEALVDFKTKQFISSKYYPQFSDADRKLKIAEIKDMYTVKQNFINQLFIGGSRGIFLGAVMGYFMKGKVAASKDEPIDA